MQLTTLDAQSAIALANSLKNNDKHKFINYAYVARRFCLDQNDELKKQIKKILEIDFHEENPS